MEKATMDILDMLLKYGALPVTIITGLWTWYKFHKQQSINKHQQEQKAELDKDIKYYEQRLTLLTEQVKFEHAKRNEDFKIWTIKRHEAYADIHENLTKLYMMLTEIQFYLWGPTEISMINSELALILLCKNLGLDKNTSNQLTAIWRINKDQAKEKLEILMQKDHEKKINQIREVINEKTFQWSLYLPIDMRNNLLNLSLESIWCLLDSNNELWRNNISEIDPKLKEAVDRCKAIMDKMVADLSGEMN